MSFFPLLVLVSCSSVTFVLVLFIPIFIGCRYENTTCKSGDYFVKDDCSQNCTCYDDFVCSPFCVDEPLGKCPIGYGIEKYRNPISGTKCFCKRRRCVKSK